MKINLCFVKKIKLFNKIYLNSQFVCEIKKTFKTIYELL